MAMAIGFSIIAHAFPIFGIQFVMPDPRQFLSQQPLDIVLVNQKTKTRPTKTDVEAQADLDGGGNTDAANHRVKSPLPADSRVPSPELEQIESQQKQLEARAEQLLTQLKNNPSLSNAGKNSPDQQQGQGQAAETRKQQDLQMAGLAAQIDKQNHDYQSKPRKAFVGARARQTSVAVYMDDWRQRIEKVGTLAYPVDSHGNKIYGQLRVTVEIAADGRLLHTEIDKSSGNSQLDAAALRILKMSSPFKKLPPDMLDAAGKPAQILVITRTWTFERQATSIN
ncbi:energy transducer TonB [Deefgea piscis]|uniref:energy transducer TonB n=1 Tax=Deefgea piscis TaxID=2739061 RepID=UPI001C7E5077|nr:energy transducer TonB [Deefgea piscis]QZA81362.1 TonB family protein [Deefgea piscis]